MKFKLGQKKILYEGKFVTLGATNFVDRSGKDQVWEWTEKNDVIAVLPIKDDGKMVLVKNYRIPVEAYVIETPAGLMDHDGESREDAIKRELLEETGYQAKIFHEMPAWPYKSGTSRNKIYGFVATGLTKMHEATGEDTEDLEAIEVSFIEAMKLWLDPPKGVLFQPEIIAMYEAAITLGIIKR